MQTTLARRAARDLARLWTDVDEAGIGHSWRLLLPRALALLTAYQRAAAASADGYVVRIAGPETAGKVLPGAFAGVASDGRPLITLLQQPVFTTLRQIGAGAAPRQALASGGYSLDMITRTQVADAGRTATGAAIAAHRHTTGYTRLVVGKTCARCLILAGRHYAWNAGFKRHPRCDCIHVPSAEDVPGGDVSTNPRKAFEAMDAAEQDRVFGRAGAQAIREGADIGRIVNARRGIQTAADGRLYTTEAAGRRPRLMPEQIFRDAADRGDAVRLLRMHGYIT